MSQLSRSKPITSFCFKMDYAAVHAPYFPSL